MRTQPTPTEANSHGTGIAVDETARLTIIMTIESRSRRKTAYRAIQRPDGVIVEKPRYRPSSAPLPDREFTVNTKTVMNAPRKHRENGDRIANSRNDDLRGVGAWEETLLKQCGRDGYNGPNAMILRESERNALCQKSLMNDGVWSTFNRRADVIVHQGFA